MFLFVRGKKTFIRKSVTALFDIPLLIEHTCAIAVTGIDCKLRLAERPSLQNKSV